jgi:hypothetical protein
VAELRLLVLFALCWPGLAADTAPTLDALRSSLIGMRGKEPASDAVRGATPQLTVAKHLLRDWVESRLRALSQSGDEGAFERKLNAELGEAKLFCDEGTADRQACPDWTFLGYLNDLKFRRSGSFLILQTSVGIDCGADESAYLYSWNGEGWRRVWQTEQNTYTKDAYNPQIIHSVLISPYNKANDYIVLTLGSESWCSSGWRHVYYRAFRLGPDLQAGPLVDGNEGAYFADDPPIRGSVTQNDVLVEFRIGSIDTLVHNRAAVRRYEFDADKPKRVDPLALSLRDFVEEWLNIDWIAAAFWSESADRGSMLDWHRKLHKDSVRGEFIYPTMHCPSTPDLWQVGVDFSDPPAPLGAEPKGTYFLVRWRPPYTFTMVKVGDRPSATCTEEDRKTDDEKRTLFPPQ